MAVADHLSSPMIKLALDWPRAGQELVCAEIIKTTAYIQTKRGDIWAMTIDHNGHPIVELAHRG